MPSDDIVEDNARVEARPVSEIVGESGDILVKMKERLSSMLENIEGKGINYEEEIGSDVAIEGPDVDITLHPSRSTPVAGELWSVFGEISNRSTVPIWIIDEMSALTLAPEMWGHASKRGSIGAFFPTIKQRSQAEVVRIDPGATYSVVWKLSSIPTEDGVKPSLTAQIANSLKNFSFFNPGYFNIFATIHVWAERPTFTEQGRVMNIGKSVPLTVYKSIEMDSSPWVLITGAAIGGLLCFIVQALYGSIIMADGFLGSIKSFIIGFLSSILLPGVSTILLSRLATTDFIFVIKVKDIWGSLATGFIIQWFGYNFISKILEAASATPK